MDTGLILFGLALFYATFRLLSGPLPLYSGALVYYAVAALALAVSYKLIWAAAGRDTPGVRYLGLQLVNFDGHRPDWRQRLLRVIGAGVSICAAGCGLLWALADRERLTWHDHISSTFLTQR